MKDILEVAAGSVLGRDHAREGKNNQDAFCTQMSGQALVGVICDGCGSSGHSEVGAQLGARLTAVILSARAERFNTLVSREAMEQFWEDVRAETLKALVPLLLRLGGVIGQTVDNYFLFTVTAVMATRAWVSIASIGDSLIALNGECFPPEKFANNEPPYLFYGLSEKADPLRWRFQLKAWLPISDFQSCLVGTDGSARLLTSAADLLPGRAEPIGPVSQFWSDDRYFRNSDALRRRLALINREALLPHWAEERLERQHGYLADDTTLIVLRRAPKGG